MKLSRTKLVSHKASFLLILCAFVPLCVAQESVIEHCPVARYTFDAPFGFVEPNAIGAEYEAHVKRANGQQSPPRREPGVFGDAIRHGNRAAVTSTFPAGSEFTISFWIYPEDVKAGSIYAIDSLFRVSIHTHKPYLIVTNHKASVGCDIQLNQWSCVSITHDGNSIGLFLNGEEMGSVEAPLAEDPFEKSVLFTSNAGAHCQFDGLIDEVRVYDQVLSHEHIKILADRDQALKNLPSIADGGVDHTLYLDSEMNARVPLQGRVTGLAADSVSWSLLKQPDEASVRIESPQQQLTMVDLNKPGDYHFRLTASNAWGESSDDVRVVVFPPHPERAPAKLFPNPETPGNHRPSFRNYPEGGPQPYSDEFASTYFPEIQPELQLKGLARDRFRPPPPPYQHPRIFFNHEDLPEMRKRLRYTNAGRSAISKVRTMYEMVTRATDGIPRDYYVAQEENGETVYRMIDGATAMYCNGAFLALVDGNTELARKLIEGAVRIADVQLAAYEAASEEKRRDWQHFGHNLLGRYTTSYLYDFLYPWMMEEERAKIREVISKATRGVDSIGMYAVGGGHGSSNWVCWVTGDLLANICAIEGEDGFDPVVYSEAARAMNNFYTFGILPDGSSFEGFGKNSLTAQNLVVLSKRGELAVAYENIYRNMADFSLHTMQPYGYQFATDDLWGSSRDPGKPADAAVLKYAYPDDPVIDFVYRNVVGGDEYQVSDLNRTYTYTNGLVNCWFGQDWDGDADWNTHANQALGETSLDQHFNYTNITTSRTAWEQGATWLYFLPRLHGGHKSPARGTFVFSSLGREWSWYPLGHNHKSSLQHSVITVDNQSASRQAGRIFAHDSNETRTLSACDLRHVYANQPLASNNAYRLNPTPEPWNDLPNWRQPNWLTGDRPNLATAPAKSRQPGVRDAWRVVSLVKESQPYALVVDEMNLDNQSHHYRWQVVLPNDLEGQIKIDGSDAIVTDPTTGNLLLIRLLNASPDITTIFGRNEMRALTVAFEANSVAARFEVMLMALPEGQPIPERGGSIPGLKQTLEEMHAVIDSEVARVEAEQNAEVEAMVAELGDFNPADLGEPLEVEYTNAEELSQVPGYLGEAFVFDGQTPLKLKGNLPPLGDKSPFTIAFWAKSDNGGSANNFFHNNGNRGLSLNIHQGRLRVSTDGHWYWHTGPDSSRQGWCHLVITYDGTAMCVYEHGEQIKSAVIEREIVGTPNGATLGSGYQGLIEGLTVFDRSLTKEEVERWYQHQTLEYRQRSEAANPQP